MRPMKFKGIPVLFLNTNLRTEMANVLVPSRYVQMLINGEEIGDDPLAAVTLQNIITDSKLQKPHIGTYAAIEVKPTELEPLVMFSLNQIFYSTDGILFYIAPPITGIKAGQTIASFQLAVDVFMSETGVAYGDIDFYDCMTPLYAGQTACYVKTDTPPPNALKIGKTFKDWIWRTPQEDDIEDD